jgi:hypothetical protein
LLFGVERAHEGRDARDAHLIIADGGDGPGHVRAVRVVVHRVIIRQLAAQGDEIPPAPVVYVAVAVVVGPV